MSTETTTGLTKSDAAALRLADEVCAHFDKERGYSLQAIKRVPYGERERNPFAEDQRIYVEVEGSITVYGADAGKDFVRSDEVTSCYASLHGAEGIWQIVKPGDRIKLRFLANNNSDNVRAVNYCRDEVQIEVIRKADLNGRKPLRFNGDVYVGPNNSARIVRSSVHGL